MVYINHNNHNVIPVIKEVVLARIKINNLPVDQKISKNELQRIHGGSAGLPDIGDDVLVAFLFGEERRPIVVGCLWNGKDVPPVSSFPDTRDIK